MDADRKDTSAGRGEPTRLNLPLLLLQSRERLIGRFRPALKRHGVTDQQYRVLRAIETHASLEPREICAICHISSPSLTGVLARMEAMGYVERERMEHDQRRQRVSLTPGGRALFRRMWPDIAAVYQQLEKELGKELTADLYRTLHLLLARVAPSDLESEE
jgi:homoprotocatechuate degradation regulator HpaR